MGVHQSISDLGPVLPPRSDVHHRARELQALAARAAEFSGNGPTADLQLALRQFEHMRALLGEGPASGSEAVGQRGYERG